MKKKTIQGTSFQKKEKKKKKQNKTKTKPIFPSSNMETKNETLSKGIGFRSNTGFFGI